MSRASEIRCYDYVSHPYQQVSDALSKDAVAVFRSATKAAAARARTIASALRVDLGGIGFEADINISIKKIERTSDIMGDRVTRLTFEWQSTKMPNLFPLMKAELSIYPLTRTETQLDFLGTYDPPLGAVGKAMDAIAGRRIAEVSVHSFVGDVAEYLCRSEICAAPERSLAEQAV